MIQCLIHVEFINTEVVTEYSRDKCHEIAQKINGILQLVLVPIFSELIIAYIIENCSLIED